jgi:hypothetical protein
MTAPAAIVTQTKLSMLSAALVLCGEKPMNSLTDPRYGAAVGGALFDMVYENELQGGTRWRFACKKAALAQINTVPPNEWMYCFQLPTDMLLPIGFFALGPDRSYEIYSNVIYTNVTSNPGPINSTAPVLTFDYMFKPDPSTVPSYFSLLVTYALARDMLKPITESDTAAQAMVVKYNRQLARAMYADSQGRPNRRIQHNPFVDVR